MSSTEEIVLESVTALLAQRGADLAVTPEASFEHDLGFDSLELAELSVRLEDRLGHDPYSAGVVPRTVGDLLGYYR